MEDRTAKLHELQKLLTDLIKVERNHSIPGTDRHENVVEHSFSLAILCWRLFEELRPPLDIAKILKYSLVHDFPERGQTQDINTYAKDHERETKQELEAKQLLALSHEFADFPDFVISLRDYESRSDEESLFVWSVDKMQAIILGQIDNWRPYQTYGVTYAQFCAKGEEFLSKCSPYLKDVFREVYEEGRRTYYDQPATHPKA